MENKKTAVDLLVASLPLRIQNMYASEIENAKAVEKEQIKQAYKDCHDLGHIYGLDTNQYYNETYENHSDKS